MKTTHNPYSSLTIVAFSQPHQGIAKKISIRDALTCFLNILRYEWPSATRGNEEHLSMGVSPVPNAKQFRSDKCPKLSNPSYFSVSLHWQLPALSKKSQHPSQLWSKNPQLSTNFSTTGFKAGRAIALARFYFARCLPRPKSMQPLEKRGAPC